MGLCRRFERLSAVASPLLLPPIPGETTDPIEKCVATERMASGAGHELVDGLCACHSGEIDATGSQA